MFTLTVETEFAAAHALTIAGVREPLHGHNWRVVATVSGERLDSDGLLCDFHTVHEQLEEIVAPFHNRNLNEVSPFTEINPSAELVAQHIAIELDRRMGSALAPHARIRSVSVSEAPRCVAEYALPA